MDYLRICRISHWIKNIFVIPGLVCALLIYPETVVDYWRVLLGLFVMCTASSANYAINEYIDRANDVHHPHKKDRPSVHARIAPARLALLYVGLALFSLVIGYSISPVFCLTVGVFLLSGIAYNVPPIKLKNLTYLDVITESFNNPVRFMAGWVLVLGTAAVPPSSALIGYWFAGAFLMNSKRFNEYMSFPDKEQLARYRVSFAGYSSFSLSFLNMLYASMAMFFMGIFLFKHRLEYLLFIPMLAVLFAYYHAVCMKPFSHQQSPQKLVYDKRLMLLCIIAALLFVFTSWVDLPLLASLAQISSAK